MNNSQAPLTLLRQAVAKLNECEQLALATFLTGTSNPKFQGLVIPEGETLGPNLAKACDLARDFPIDSKIFFAIELLELQINRNQFEEDSDDSLLDTLDNDHDDADDGLPDPSDYEGEEYYGSDRPALDGEEPGNHYYQPSFSVPG